MNGECPYCKRPVMKLNGAGVEVSFGIGTKSFKALTYSCGACNAVLSCQIDPIAVRTETVALTVEDLLRELKR